VREDAGQARPVTRPFRTMQKGTKQQCLTENSSCMQSGYGGRYVNKTQLLGQIKQTNSVA
jgi:hypothetical protein